MVCYSTLRFPLSLHFIYIRVNQIQNFHVAPDLGANVVLLASHEVFARLREVHAADGVLVPDEEGLAVRGSASNAADVADDDGRPERVECHGEAGTGDETAGHGS